MNNGCDYYLDLSFLIRLFLLNKQASLADVIFMVWATDVSEYPPFTLRVLAGLWRHPVQPAFVCFIKSAQPSSINLEGKSNI